MVLNPCLVLEYRYPPPLYQDLSFSPRSTVFTHLHHLPLGANEKCQCPLFRQLSLLYLYVFGFIFSIVSVVLINADEKKVEGESASV